VTLNRSKSGRSITYPPFLLSDEEASAEAVRAADPKEEERALSEDLWPSLIGSIFLSQDLSAEVFFEDAPFSDERAFTVTWG
jgi:hypothetical protein